MKIKKLSSLELKAISGGENLAPDLSAAARPGLIIYSLNLRIKNYLDQYGGSQGVSDVAQLNRTEGIKGGGTESRGGRVKYF